jgi:hypothetical protein
MKHSDNIQNELNEINSSLPGKANGSVLSVPEGYFEGFAASVLNRIKKANVAESASAEIAQLSPFLAGISRSMPFEVPDNYFQTNIDVLPSIVSDKESLVLSFIDKDMPFEVPKGYFFNLPEQVMESVESHEPKVVKMSGRKWMRMAVAAMIAGIITVSGIVYFKTDNSGSIDKDAVANQNTKADINKELKTVSTAELDAFINTRVVTEDYSATVNNTAKTSDVKTLLEDVSDKELEAFLDQVPTDVEEEIVL